MDILALSHCFTSCRSHYYTLPHPDPSGTPDPSWGKAGAYANAANSLPQWQLSQSLIDAASSPMGKCSFWQTQLQRRRGPREAMPVDSVLVIWQMAWSWVSWAPAPPSCGAVLLTSSISHFLVLVTNWRNCPFGLPCIVTPAALYQHDMLACGVLLFLLC